MPRLGGHAEVLAPRAALPDGGEVVGEAFGVQRCGHEDDAEVGTLLKEVAEQYEQEIGVYVPFVHCQKSMVLKVPTQVRENAIKHTFWM